MKTTPKSNSITSNKSTSSLRLIFGMTFVLFSFSGVFAQDTTIANEGTVSGLVFPSNEGVVHLPQPKMEMVFWLMGSKQIQSGAIPSDDSGMPMSQKRQFLNYGMTPNRILSRSFLKKAINYESTMA